MAALPHTVEVLEQCRISPPSSSVSTISLPLTYFDIFWVALPPSQRIFFYQVDYVSKPHFMNTILPNIKRSLSLTLHYFFALAGNLSWPQDSSKPEILCIMEGDSVTLTVVESSYDFHHLSGHHQRDLNDFFHLIPPLPDPKNGKLFPVLALQVTLFPNKGICIGVTYHHAVGDGNTIMLFIRAWACVSRSQGNTSFITKSLPCYERSMVKDTGELETKFLKYLKGNKITKETFNVPSNPPVVPSDKVVATFVIRPSDINRLREWVVARLEGKNIIPPKHLSTFVLTCAYVWICLIKARPRSEDDVSGGGGDEDLIEHFIILVDCRARLDPPLPPTYFGNCIASGVVETKRSPLLEEDGVAIAASLIGNVIQNYDAANAMTSSSYKLCPDRLVSVAGSPKLGAYDTDFGWGNPKKAEVGTIGGAGAICLCESPTQIGAIEVGLARTKIEMDRFTSLFENTIQSFPSENC